MRAGSATARRYHDRRDRWLEVGPPTTAPSLEAPVNARGVWPEHLVRGLLEAHGIPVAPARLATSALEAKAFAGEFEEPARNESGPRRRWPTSRDIGGVALNVEVDQVTATFDELKKRLAVALPEATLDGVLVGPIAHRALNYVGGGDRSQPGKSPVALGLGGVWVEVLGDVAA